MHDFTLTRPSQTAERERILRDLFGSIGEGVWIEPALRVSCGSHTHLGWHVSANFGLVLVDDADVRIDDRVLLGPNVVSTTEGHPIDPVVRATDAHFAYRPPRTAPLPRRAAPRLADPQFFDDTPTRRPATAACRPASADPRTNCGSASLRTRPGPRGRVGGAPEPGMPAPSGRVVRSLHTAARGARMDAIDPDDQLVVAPDAGQQRWIAEQLAVLRDVGVAPDLNALEECFAEQHAEWWSAPEQDRRDPAAAIAAVGVGWGQALVDAVGLRWAIVHDRTGTDLAVVDEAGAVVLYPVGAIAKRWDDRRGSLAGMGERLLQQVRGVRTAPLV